MLFSLTPGMIFHWEKGRQIAAQRRQVSAIVQLQQRFPWLIGNDGTTGLTVETLHSKRKGTPLMEEERGGRVIETEVK